MSERSKTYSSFEAFKYLSFTFLMFLVILIGIGEIIIRIVSEELPYKEKANLNEQIGWVTKENYTSEYVMNEFGEEGRLYPVKYQTFQHGFRAWGDLRSSKPKVFFIGDSYVQAVEVSNDKTFYHHLKDSLDIEVFAYGHAGYGTLQELMILKKYIEIIDPDLIVLQTCDNDFIDNHAPLEYNSTYKVGLRRPYYNLEKKTIYRMAMPRYQELIDKSKFLGLLRKKLENTFPGVKGLSAQQRMTKDGRRYLPYDESIRITSLILSDMKETAGSIPVIAFSASPYEPQVSAFKEISEVNGIPFNAEVGKRIQKMVWSKVNLLSSDGYHWNELGHKRVAGLLVDDLYSVLNKN